MTQTGEQAPRAPLLEPPPHRPSPYERFVRVGIVAWCGIGVIVLGYLMVRLMVYVNPVVPPLLWRGPASSTSCSCASWP